MPLTPDEIEEIRLHAHRYAGPFTPTYQRLASAVERLAQHIQETNAVCGDDLPTTEETAEARDHILRGAEELKRRRAVEGWREKTVASSNLHHGVGESCASCRHWHRGRGEAGVCRRYPPRVGQERPEVMSSEWCGEYQSLTPHPLRVMSAPANLRVGG